MGLHSCFIAKLPQQLLQVFPVLSQAYLDTATSPVIQNADRSAAVPFPTAIIVVKMISASPLQSH